VTTRIEAAVAPYFDLARRAWIPCIVLWAPETGEFARTEGPSASGHGTRCRRRAIAMASRPNQSIATGPARSPGAVVGPTSRRHRASDPADGGREVRYSDNWNDTRGGVQALYGQVGALAETAPSLRLARGFEHLGLGTLNACRRLVAFTA